MIEDNLALEAHVVSHVGRVKKANEDNYLLLELANSKFITNSQKTSQDAVKSLRTDIGQDGVILAVSDGFGASFTGSEASKITIESVRSVILNENKHGVLVSDNPNKPIADKLYDAILYANKKIHWHKERTNFGEEECVAFDFGEMGATFTGVAITNRTIDLAQIGDSRAYLIRKSQIYQLTKDQTLVQQLIDTQEITPEQAEIHPLKSILLQVLGEQSEIYPVEFSLTPCNDDILLVCTDGLSNELSEMEMTKTVMDNKEDLKKGATALVKQANENSSEDNKTVILAQISGKNYQN